MANTNGGQGFELTNPKEWLVKAAPYLKASLKALKLAAGASRLAGFPVPDFASGLSDFLNDQMSVLEDLKGSTVEMLSSAVGMEQNDVESALDSFYEKTEGILNESYDLSSQPKLTGDEEKVLNMSAQALQSMLEKVDTNWKAKVGLEKVTARDGTTAWVKPEHKEEFMRRGKAILAEKTKKQTPSDDVKTKQALHAEMKREASAKEEEMARAKEEEIARAKEEMARAKEEMARAKDEEIRQLRAEMERLKLQSGRGGGSKVSSDVPILPGQPTQTTGTSDASSSRPPGSVKQGWAAEQDLTGHNDVASDSHPKQKTTEKRAGGNCIIS